MSKGARLRPERMRVRNPLLVPWSPPRPGERIEVHVAAGVTIDTPDTIAEMQKLTHDGLITELGSRRRSGVKWKHTHGADECLQILSEVWGDDPAIADDVAQYRAFIDKYGEDAVLIIAMAEWAVPRGSGDDDAHS